MADQRKRSSDDKPNLAWNFEASPVERVVSVHPLRRQFKTADGMQLWLSYEKEVECILRSRDESVLMGEPTPRHDCFS